MDTLEPRILLSGSGGFHPPGDTTNLMAGSPAIIVDLLSPEHESQNDNDWNFYITDNSMHGSGFGDADLSQSVTFADFMSLANNFGQTDTGWLEGNFNLDNVTNFADFVLLANNFGGQYTPNPDLNETPGGMLNAADSSTQAVTVTITGTDDAPTGTPGDFDGDDDLDQADIDLLRNEIITTTGSSDPQFNVDGVGVSSTPDVNDWNFYITDNSMHGSGFGDADLSQSVTFADFVSLANNFGQTGTGWLEGNFNLDNVTNFADFVLLANNFDGQYIPNPDLNETPGGMLNAALSNRNPDCRTYALDANDGDYSSRGADDRSNFNEDAPYYPGTEVASTVYIDLVIVGGDYIQDPDNPTVPGGWDYETVTPTTDPELATHCRMVHNMIPNHDFGRDVGLRTEPDVWVTEIDHDDRQVTYLPVHPRMSDPRVADDTDRNPTNFMDYDGVLLNGIGIAMDSGFCYNPAHRRANAAGNATGCGGLSVWYEIPAYTLQEPEAENMAAIFDDYFGHGFEGSYHYHAITHPLQQDDDQYVSSAPNGSPLIGFAKDGFPIYGHWFVNPQGELVKAQSGYVLKTYELNEGNSRDPVLGLPPNFDRGTPPTPWDIANRPQDFDSDVGIPLGRYLDDWVYDDGNTGNLDECNGATDINGVYGYYVTDTYPYAPICTFGVHEPSFGKVPPLRWHNETTENTHDDHGQKINGH